MSEKIALLLQKHYITYCKKELLHQKLPCEVQYFEYTTLSELQEIFKSIQTHYDGFMTSGTIPLQAICEIDTPPYHVCQCFGGYLENTYRILLREVLKKGFTDASGIGLDYLDDHTTLEEILEKDQLFDLIRNFEKSTQGLTEKELEAAEKGIIEKYNRRLQEGNLELVITNFYSVVDAMKKEGVECYYSYPSARALVQALELCVKNIQLEKIQRHMAAVIRIHPSYADLESRKVFSRETSVLELKGILLEYCREHLLEPVMKDDLTDVEIYLNAEQMGQLTDNYQVFDLALWIKQRIGMEVTAGIGVGVDLQKARIHAVQAMEYAKKIGKEYGICMDGDGNLRRLALTGTKPKDTGSVPNDYVIKVANKVHLSSETILRVITAMQIENSRELTAGDLVRLQNFSPRIANRVLNALEKEGYARQSGEQRWGNKGRPQKVYQIHLEYQSL